MTDPLHSNHHTNLVSLWKHNPIKQKSTLVKYLELKLFPPFPSCPPSHKEHLHSPTVTQALRRCTSELVYNVAVPGFSGKFLTMITLPPHWSKCMPKFAFCVPCEICQVIALIIEPEIEILLVMLIYSFLQKSHGLWP